MKLTAETIELLSEVAEMGSTLAISDVGVGASMCRAALTGASLNIFINTKLMKDREYAENLNNDTEGLMEKYAPMAEEIFDRVLGKLR